MGEKDKDNKFDVEVATPNGVYRGEFEKTDKVQDVIDAVIEDRDLAEGDAFELRLGNQLLEPTQRTLVSFGIVEAVTLVLLATGSGVSNGQSG